MPAVRLRRLREKSAIRDWVSETQLCLKNIILPYFVVEGKGRKAPVKAMPGVDRLSIDNLLKDIADAPGIPAVLLFGIPETKDETGAQSYKKNGIVQKAVKAIKKEFKNLVVITDVCLCGYTAHGHCGIIKAQGSTLMGTGKLEGRRAKVKAKDFPSSFQLPASSLIIDNDSTLEVLTKIALSHAEAGADFVAPSAMIDGQVKAIREGLDKNEFGDVGILAYSAKYASGFYGPFREALDSTPQFGDRKSYQMDFRNSDQALREVEQDIDQGADIVMIKPALAYLDIIHRVKQKFNIPVAAYNVSGEYAMVKAYCRNSEMEKKIVLEMLTGIKRAGADLIITYWAKDVVKWLKH